MDPKQLLGELQRKIVRPAYLFSGDQNLPKEEALEALRRALDGRVQRFEGPQARAGEILEAQRNFSLLGRVALIVIRQAARLAKPEADLLLEALREDQEKEAAGPEGLPQRPPLVFWDDTLAKRGGLFAMIARSGGEVEFAALRGGTLQAWVSAEAKRLGHPLAPGVGELLADSVGSDQLRLRAALEVLSLYVGPQRVIDESAVLQMVPAAREHAMYELQDALSARDGAKALRLFRAALDEGHEIPLLVAVLYAEVKRLLIAKGVSPDSAARKALAAAGTVPFKIDRLIQCARGFPLPRLRKAMDRLPDIDIAFKTGRGEPVSTLEDWILSLCAARH